MTSKQLNTALYDKMAAEQEKYRDWLLKQTPEEILNHTFEYTAREDILIASETLDLPEAQMKALLASLDTMADIYKTYCNMIDSVHMDVIRESIEDRAVSLLKLQREKNRGIPLYKESLMYARKHGELDVFRASRKANVACREAIEAAIRDGYDGMYLNADVKGVLAEFGPERVSYVLAATLQDETWDGRFSRSNQEWAAAVPVWGTRDQRLDYHVNSHSTLLDGFVSMVRSELDEMREQPEKKPSIKAQLAAKPVSHEQSARPKEQEAR